MSDKFHDAEPHGIEYPLPEADQQLLNMIGVIIALLGALVLVKFWLGS